MGGVWGAFREGGGADLGTDGRVRCGGRSAESVEACRYLDSAFFKKNKDMGKHRKSKN